MAIVKRVKKILVKLFDKKVVNSYDANESVFYWKQKGYCPCCEQSTFFIAQNPWLRDHFKCTNCNCIPRERALMLAIKEQYPNWENLKIHESSPGKRGHSVLLKKKAANYVESQYFPDKPLGVLEQGFQNEDLEQQTFIDESFDLVITSDVMEHIYNPEKAFQEIHRTLKLGGAHIFSVPLINRFEKTQRWANKGTEGEPEFLFEPEWHGNPVSKNGSPVTMHWGYDIVEFIKNCTGAVCSIAYYDDLHHGISAEFREIIIAKKIN